MPKGQSFRLDWESLSRTMHPLEMLGCWCCHFRRCCRVARYCLRHLSQKVLLRLCTISHCCLYRSGFPKSPGGTELTPVFWVSSVAGVRMKGSAGSVDTGINGLLFIMAVTSAIKVVSTLCVSLEDVLWRSIESKILRASPIILSHACVCVVLLLYENVILHITHNNNIAAI